MGIHIQCFFKSKLNLVFGVVLKARARASACTCVRARFHACMYYWWTVAGMLAKTADKVSDVIELHVPDEVLEQRIVGRWIHKKSGRSYHVTNNPPKSLVAQTSYFAFMTGPPTPSAENMLDDVTGEPLMQRSDDTADALKQRLSSYTEKTEAVLEHYSPHGITAKINANQAMDTVWTELKVALEIAK